MPENGSSQPPFPDGFASPGDAQHVVKWAGAGFGEGRQAAQQFDHFGQAAEVVDAMPASGDVALHFVASPPGGPAVQHIQERLVRGAWLGVSAGGSAPERPAIVGQQSPAPDVYATADPLPSFVTDFLDGARIHAQ